ncbi:MAG: hypothetical protein MPJ24_06285 [Pirellulaceae bacterium]|nr:hypothetical protein [Pirellulaceae bacterium]
MARPTTTMTDHFGNASRFLFSMENYDFEHAYTQMKQQLNMWGSEQTIEEQPLSPLVSTLPKELLEHSLFQRQQALRYYREDMIYLQQCQWMLAVSKQISQKVSTQQQRQGINLTITKAEKEKELAKAIFDWVIYSTELVETVPYPAQEEAQNVLVRRRKNYLASAEGLAGPGYTHFPIQTMLYGKGDTQERARLFVALARQQKLNAFILAFKKPRPEDGVTNPSKSSGRLDFWLPAVVIEKKLYLFDTTLGLPLYHPQTKELLTLGEIVTENDLLKFYDTPENNYSSIANNFDDLCIAIDLPEPAFSERMRRIELQLAGTQSADIYHSLDEQLTTLKQIPSLENRPIVLWHVPQETLLYRAKYHSILRNRVSVQQEHFFKEGIFLREDGLRKGRYYHVRGQYQPVNTEDRLSDHKSRQDALGQYRLARLFRSQEQEINKDIQNKLEGRLSFSASYSSKLRANENDPDKWDDRVLLQAIVTNSIETGTPPQIPQEIFSRLELDEQQELQKDLDRATSQLIDFSKETKELLNLRFEEVPNISELGRNEKRAINSGRSQKTREAIRFAKYRTVLADYFIGLCHYENEDYGASLASLKTLKKQATTNLSVTEENRLPYSLEKINYLIARVYEATNDLTRAKELLKESQSPQRHGNRIRAKLLAEGFSL